jgi:hypothetical protein
VEEAATILGVSERQCYRIKVRVKEHGAKEVIHGNEADRVSARSRRRPLAGWWH